MVRFAHMADVHLGAFREPRLREANLEAFLKALDLCAAEKVDFVLICGDLFHTSLPDMGVVERATAKLRELIDAGIPVYIIYGSHDFSAAERSIVDVLHSAGVFDKVTRAGVRDDGSVELEGTVDERTGAVLAGLPGRKLGLDISYYEKLDASKVLARPGPKIFAFHGAITEMKPRELAEMSDSMPASLLPKGFDYYAGGHVHERLTSSMPGWGLIAYPGPLFGDGYRDLESAETRGFYIVELRPGEGPALEFMELPARKTRLIEVDARDRTPEEVNRELKQGAEQAKAKDAIVLVKVRGELSTGKASEVDTDGVRRLLARDGAFTVYVSRGGLSTRERAMIRIEGEEGRADIETKLLRENLANHPSKMEGLKGEEGLARARRLLLALSEEKPGMTRADHETAILKVTEEVLFGAPAGGTPVDGGPPAGEAAAGGTEVGGASAAVEGPAEPTAPQDEGKGTGEGTAKKAGDETGKETVGATKPKDIQRKGGRGRQTRLE